MESENVAGDYHKGFEKFDFGNIGFNNLVAFSLGIKVDNLKGVQVES